MSPKHTHHVPHLHRVGKWMPRSHETQKSWLGSIINHVDQNPKPLHPVLLEFQQLIETNTRIYLLISSMFEEIPHKAPYNADPSGNPQIRDYQHLLCVLNHLLTTAPGWTDAEHRVGLVGLPINAVLDWPMGTPSGYAFFLDPEVNAMLKKVLNAWGEFLKSEESASVLNDSPTGWFGKSGKNDLTFVANLGHDYEASTANEEAKYSFDELFVSDPTAKHRGYKSWDDFFIRRFRDGMRPVAEPNNTRVIANACESTPFKVARNVKRRDRFWVKGQSYSVDDMLAHDDLAEQFVGGTVYQAFLSALSYHRWHAPISGKIVKAYVVDGTYYSEPLYAGLGNPAAQGHIDPAGEVVSQGFLPEIATRAIIFIQSDDPAVGVVAFIGVGMVEVSTCDIHVKQGQYIKKGEELGCFHFGGSTHCLLFQKGVNVNGFPRTDGDSNKKLGSQVAVVED